MDARDLHLAISNGRSTVLAGQIVPDGPVPVRVFTEGHASHHLDRHLGPQNGLRP
jgi:hypothetical protein